MQATELKLGDKYPSLPDNNHLLCVTFVTSEQTRGQLGGKENLMPASKCLCLLNIKGVRAI